MTRQNEHEGRRRRGGRAHGGEGGRGRMRHGDVRAALLLALVDGPAHGYEIGQRLLRASGGAWQPSAGSIYPTLQMLDDEGLVTSEERDQKRIYAITAKGRASVRERKGRGEGAPWEAATSEGGGELRTAVVALKMAAKQIGVAGNAEQREKAIAIVNDARRALYELLAKG